MCLSVGSLVCSLNSITAVEEETFGLIATMGTYQPWYWPGPVLIRLQQRIIKFLQCAYGFVRELPRHTLARRLTKAGF
jgi:hypothetical protein